MTLVVMFVTIVIDVMIVMDVNYMNSKCNYKSVL